MNDNREKEDNLPTEANSEYYLGPITVSSRLKDKLSELRERAAEVAANKQREKSSALKLRLADYEAKRAAYTIQKSKQDVRKKHDAILSIADCAIGAALTREQRAAEEKVITDAVSRHLIALRRELRKSVVLDPYGGVERDERLHEIKRFLRSTGLDRNKFHIRRAISLVWAEFCRLENASRSLGFDPESYPNNGHAFEAWVASSLSIFGWKTQVTRGSGDQGVDVIATLGNTLVAIQAKCYSGTVGNAAVQEIFSGAAHLGIHYAVVIATSKFTPSAIELAQSTGVHLLHVSDIPHLQEILTKPSLAP